MSVCLVMAGSSRRTDGKADRSTTHFMYSSIYIPYTLFSALSCLSFLIERRWSAFTGGSSTTRSLLSCLLCNILCTSTREKKMAFFPSTATKSFLFPGAIFCLITKMSNNSWLTQLVHVLEEFHSLYFFRSRKSHCHARPCTEWKTTQSATMLLY